MLAFEFEFIFLKEKTEDQGKLLILTEKECNCSAEIFNLTRPLITIIFKTTVILNERYPLRKFYSLPIP